jgi:adenine specific DNA methylase Mod
MSSGNTDKRRTSAPDNRGAKADNMSNMTSQPTDDAAGSLGTPPSSGLMRVTRTELVWPGKYNDDGTRKEVPRVGLPFQVIEAINESQATREARKKTQPTLFDIYEGTEGDTFETGWKNKLIWGDNLLVMGALLEKFAGKIDLIYIDPPFATGADFSFRTFVGDEEVIKEASIIEDKAYRDTWGLGLPSFVQMLFDRFQLMRDLLSDKGSIYIHIGWDVSHYVKAVLDDVFGSNRLVNQIIWKRQTAHSDVRQGSEHFGRVHDCPFLYSKTDSFVWNQQYTAHDEKYVNSHYTNLEPGSGRRYRLDNITAPGGASKGNPYYEFLGVTRYWRYSKEKMQELYEQGRIVLPKGGTIPAYKRYLDETPGVPLQDLWVDINAINSQAKEALGYATQKPEKLVERIVINSSNEGAIVADFFSGSGTTPTVSEKLKRRWIACDLSRFGIHVTRKRLLGIEQCKPFELLNLGKYERQYWQGVTFAKKGKPVSEQALYEYLAFLLRLYGAQPVAGLAHLHGKKGRAMVHIGAVDAPVTIDEINLALDECAKLRQPELHLLGWEWEMGLSDLMVGEAKRRGIKLLLLQIPREVMEQQAVDKGDIQFFELAYLEVEVKPSKKLTATVTLKDFVIPNTELIPEEVRSKVKKWSDYVDYWAVDWNFQHDTFLQGWVSYRTRKDRTLALTSDPHTYDKAGKYRILVKVIDIFGNDTSQAFDVEVK